jgi:Na+/melibiose symporter-like transporter
MGDRGFILLFGSASAVLYAVFAIAPVSYLWLLVAMVLLTSSFLFVSSAQNALASIVGQQHAISGQVSTVWNIAASVPTVAALLIGGVISDALHTRNADEAARALFLFGAAIMTCVAIYAVWKPKGVFDNPSAQRADAPQRLRDLKRLARHSPIYPALIIWLIWNFAPGSATPLQYYLQDTLQAKDSHWGEWNAIFAASFIPTFMVFGLLCQRFPLRSLLWWGTVIAIPQLVPLLFIGSVTGALFAAVPIGLMGGIATAAYLDLIIRSAPSGLQGTMMMLSGSVSYVSARLGDVLGTHLYDHYGGFTACVIAITVAYALILPILLLVPQHLIATADAKDAAAGSNSDSDAA